jgi:hypothetical protein
MDLARYLKFLPLIRPKSALSFPPYPAPKFPFELGLTADNPAPYTNIIHTPPKVSVVSNVLVS